jgi:hypothetical protein
VPAVQRTLPPGWMRTSAGSEMHVHRVGVDNSHHRLGQTAHLDDRALHRCVDLAVISESADGAENHPERRVTRREWALLNAAAPRTLLIWWMNIGTCSVSV